MTNLPKTASELLFGYVVNGDETIKPHRADPSVLIVAGTCRRPRGRRAFVYVYQITTDGAFVGGTVIS